MQRHSNSAPDNKVLGEEVWGLEASCYSWNCREAVKLDRPHRDLSVAPRPVF